jgi:hypothetical protein
MNNDEPMNEEPSDDHHQAEVVDEWARQFWVPRDPTSVDPFEQGDAFVHFVVFGVTADELDVDPDAYAVREVPDGIEAIDVDEGWIETLFEPPMGDLLREPDPLVGALCETADRAIVVTGSVDDPATLDYLRDCIGIATAALDRGGLGVLSLQSLALFGPDRWRTEIFTGGPDVARRLVAVLYSEDEATPGGPDGSLWVHTRGMRLFGRPDLSIRGVPADELDRANRLCQALVERLAAGLRIPDGSAMDLGSGVGEVTFAHAGHLDDPEFNNVHLAITWPT